MAEEKTLEEQLQEAQAKIKELEELADKQKKAIDNACADASKHKKDAQEWADKYKEKLSEQEKADLEVKQALEAQTNELNALRKDKAVYENTAKLIAQGYDEANAKEAAEALYEGNTEKFFECQKKFIDAKTQAIKTQTLNTQPNLTIGNTPTAKDAEDAETAKIRRWMGVR